MRALTLETDGTLNLAAARLVWTPDSMEPEIAGGFRKVIAEPQAVNPLTQTVTQNPRSQWIVSDDAVTVTYAVTDKPLAEVKAALKERITAYREQLLTGGYTTAQGMQIDTSVASQNRITSIVSGAQYVPLGDDVAVDYKTKTGMVSITIGQVKQIAGLLGAFMRDCYASEKTHFDAVDALADNAAAAQYDTTTAWPENHQ